MTVEYTLEDLPLGDLLPFYAVEVMAGRMELDQAAWETRCELQESW